MKFISEVFLLIFATVLGFIFNISTIAICNLNPHKVHNVSLTINHADGQVFQHTLQCGVVTGAGYNLRALVMDETFKLVEFYRKNYPNGKGEPSSMGLISSDGDGVVVVNNRRLVNCSINGSKLSVNDAFTISSNDVVVCDAVMRQ